MNISIDQGHEQRACTREKMNEKRRKRQREKREGERRKNTGIKFFCSIFHLSCFPQKQHILTVFVLE